MIITIWFNGKTWECFDEKLASSITEKIKKMIASRKSIKDIDATIEKLLSHDKTHPNP